jgi:hypothetical protein
MTTSPERWARAEDVVWRRTLDATLVLARDVTVLEGGARIIWELLEHAASVPELVEDIVAASDAPAATVRGDVVASLASLSSSGLVRRASGAPSAPVPQRRPLPSPTIPDDPIASMAAWGLGTTSHLPDIETIGWDTFITSVTRERLAGIVYGAVVGGDLALDDEQRAVLAELHRRSMLVALRHERLLVDTVRALADAGIQAMVHKGPSIAHVAYDDPALRPFGDIDLLLPSDAIDDAFALLEARGSERRYSEPRPGFDRRFGKGAAFVTADGLELDVHRTFASGPFGLTVDLDDARRDPSSIVVGGFAVPVLGRPQQLVAVALHAALGTRFPRLLNLRDVVQLLVLEDADPEEAVRTAERWRVDAALARAVRAAADTFRFGDDDLPLAGWARAHVPSRRQRRALDAYVAPGRGYSRQAAAALPVIPGIRLRAAYLRAMLLPDPTYEADRGERWLHRWRRIARTIVLDRR